ncbi:MAG: hypothetical protein ACJARP_002020 [Vicingaceae bacterium]
MNIVSSYPLWYFGFCVLLGGLLAFLLYRNDKKLTEFSKLTKGVLFGLRFLCVTALATMLLSPLIKYFSKTVEKPIIVIAQDNSASMLMASDSTFVRQQLQEQIAAVQQKLGANFKIDNYVFDEAIGNETKPNFSGRITDFDVLFEDLEQKYVNRNVGALLLVTDGIYNQGNSPVYSIQNLEFPVFTVGVGDTNRYVDIKLKNLRNNKLAFLGNEFPVQVDIKTQKVTVNSVKLTVLRNGKTITTKTLIGLKANDVSTQYLTLKANAVGKQQYTIIVQSIEGERNTSNNSLNFYIDVLDGRQKVLLLGMAPHPDLGALKSAIAANENYELTTSIYSDFKKSFKEYDLVMLHQSSNSKLVPIDQNLKKLLGTSIPVLLFGGGWKNVELLQGISGKSSGRRIVNELQAEINEGFSLFTIDDDLRKLTKFPPVTTEASQTVKPNGNNTLLTQKIGNVKTAYPLLTFFEKQNRKIGRFSGEGLWKWRIANYQEFGNHQVFNRFVSKITQYMAVKSDRSFFRVSSVDEIYENEALNFSAQLFNPSYELVNDPEVSLEVKNEEGKVFNFAMNRLGETYQLNIPSLLPGNYNYVASATYQGKLVTEKGIFRIKELQLEASNTEADHQLLFQLAKRTNGEMVDASNVLSIVEKINAREDISSVSYMNEEVEDIINLKWIFFVLLALLSIEWFIRKRGGAY